MERPLITALFRCKRSIAGRDVPMAEDLLARDVAIDRLNRETLRPAPGAGAGVREWAMIEFSDASHVAAR